MTAGKSGFTLVELLIVIVIIGILAGGLMLAMTSSRDSANASVLVSDLRNTKSAGLMWFADNIGSDDVVLITEWTSANMPLNLSRKYLDNKAKAMNYTFKYIAGVGFMVGQTGVHRAVVDKAVGQAGGFLMDSSGNVLVRGLGVQDVYVVVK